MSVVRGSVGTIHRIAIFFNLPKTLSDLAQNKFYYFKVELSFVNLIVLSIFSTTVEKSPSTG